MATEVYVRVEFHELTIAQDAVHPVLQERATLRFRENEVHFFHPETGASVDARVKANG